MISGMISIFCLTLFTSYALWQFGKGVTAEARIGQAATEADSFHNGRLIHTEETGKRMEREECLEAIGEDCITHRETNKEFIACAESWCPGWNFDIAEKLISIIRNNIVFLGSSWHDYFIGGDFDDKFIDYVISQLSLDENTFNGDTIKGEYMNAQMYFVNHCCKYCGVDERDLQNCLENENQVTDIVGWLYYFLNGYPTEPCHSGHKEQIINHVKHCCESQSGNDEQFENCLQGITMDNNEEHSTKSVKPDRKICRNSGETFKRKMNEVFDACCKAPSLITACFSREISYSKNVARIPIVLKTFSNEICGSTKMQEALPECWDMGDSSGKEKCENALRIAYEQLKAVIQGFLISMEHSDKNKHSGSQYTPNSLG